MELQKVVCISFSATGTTKKVVNLIGQTIAKALQIPYEERSFTLPKDREIPITGQGNVLYIIGTPVYAGRVPNVLLPYLKEMNGNDSFAVPIVLYGNRNYDDALIELRDLLENGGFHTVAGGVFVGEHAFSYELAKGRPDEQDRKEEENFALQVAKQMKSASKEELLLHSPVFVKGETPLRPYYTPRDRKGNPIDIRKVKSLVSDHCDDCKVCANVCPMGSISFENVREYTGICIKCGACIKKCPQSARYYEDEGYLYHKTELEEEYQRRGKNEVFCICSKEEK